MFKHNTSDCFYSTSIDQIAFFLVDPLRPIPSTTDVPPQQLEWTLREIRRLRNSERSQLPKLPDEIWAQIESELGLMDSEKAKVVREELMAERGRLVRTGEGETFACVSSLSSFVIATNFHPASDAISRSVSIEGLSMGGICICRGAGGGTLFRRNSGTRTFTTNDHRSRLEMTCLRANNSRS